MYSDILKEENEKLKQEIMQLTSRCNMLNENVDDLSQVNIEMSEKLEKLGRVEKDNE